MFALILLGEGTGRPAWSDRRADEVVINRRHGNSTRRDNDRHIRDRLKWLHSLAAATGVIGVLPYAMLHW